MLRDDIRQAVADGLFSIYCAAKIEDVMEILSELPRGKLNAKGKFSRNSFNYRVQQRITELQKLQKQFAQSGSEGSAAKGKRASQ